MRAECLPFASIPHTSKLFLDFLSGSGKAHQFYPRSPHLRDWSSEEAKLINYPDDRRKQVADILEQQNHRFGSGAKTSENLAKFRDGSKVVVTGQQVGVFGGPLFSILKALTALELAAQAEASGVPTVPVFWLATEDHDLAEVSQVSVPGSDGSLHRIGVQPQAIEDAPVGDVRFGDEITAEVEKLAELLGPSDTTDVLVAAYRPGEKMGDAFAKLFAHIFAEWGVILIDAYDPAFHKIAEPIYRKAIEQSEELNRLLLERGKQLESDGYHQQVKVTSTSTLLFEIVDGKRSVIQRSNGDFKIGGHKSSKEELLARIAASPEKFSANVLLRPVMQDYLLPTLAYTGGPAEVAYFTQVGVVQKQLLGRATPVIPRFSATIVEPKQEKLLQKYSLRLSDVLTAPDNLRVLMAQHVLPSSLQANFETAEKAVVAAMDRIRTDLKQLDPTLIDAANGAEKKMRYQINRLSGRAARAELLRNEVIDGHARNLSSHLFPNKDLPERQIAGVYYLAKYGLDLLKPLYDTAQNECPDHQVLFV